MKSAHYVPHVCNEYSQTYQMNDKYVWLIIASEWANKVPAYLLGHCYPFIEIYIHYKDGVQS